MMKNSISIRFAGFLIASLLPGRMLWGQVIFDCVNTPACAPLTINGAPGFDLPDSSISVMRGMADADIAFEPDSSKLYLSYTFITSNLTPTANPNYFIKDPSVSIQLASSTDFGQTWNYVKTLKQSASEINPTTVQQGFSGYEVSSIVKGDSLWYMAYLRFHDPVGNGNNRVNSSFYIGITKSNHIYNLDASAEVKLAGNFADTVWIDYSLSDVATECSECDLWLDPELFFQQGRLYLLATCEPYDNGIRITDSTFYGVFEIELNGMAFGQPTWVGKIAYAADAVVFGADELSKADLVYASDSSLLLLAAPVFQGTLFEEYPGAYVFSANFGASPSIYRDTANTPLVSAIIISSDSEPTSGSAAYHSLSNTGIILTRRELYPSQQRLEWRLHQTGVHPQSSVSVHTLASTHTESFHIYPNPADGIIRINCTKGYKLFSASGHLLKANSGSTSEIDISELPEGMYFLQCNNHQYKFLKIKPYTD